jgi:hypothetical protein
VPAAVGVARSGRLQTEVSSQPDLYPSAPGQGFGWDARPIWRGELSKHLMEARRFEYDHEMARPPRWQSTLDASVEEACLAVRLYNDPAEPRSFEGFVVHMHLAWLYLLHAEFIRDHVDHRYWDPNRKKRLLKIDGEPKM